MFSKSPVTIGHSDLKESSVSLINNLLVTHLARRGFEILHFHSLHRIERNASFMVNQALN